MTTTRLLAARSDVRHIRRFPSDHHPASLTWKLIDLTAKQQHPGQEQVVKSAPLQPQQSLKSVDTGRRQFISELFYDASGNNCCAFLVQYSFSWTPGATVHCVPEKRSILYSPIT